MTIHQFIAQRRASWNELASFVRRCSELGLERVPLDEFQQGSARYRQAVSDLALARARFPGHALLRELEALVSNAHSIIYRDKLARRSQWTAFWLREYPRLVRAESRLLLTSVLLFWGCAVLGAALTLGVPALGDLFVAPHMREALQQHHLWTENLTSMSPQASSRIAQNNIAVSLTTWALGLSFGIGTMYMLALNGLMLGAVAVACLRYGMLGALGEFIVAHGALELPAIWLAGAAGMVLARGLVLPGRYARRINLRLEGRRSVRLVIGTVPILLVAAMLEGFVSPSELPGMVKCAVAALFGLGLFAWLALAGRGAAASEADAPL
jgi:uncharacterized membrane protein SpoIIM required for sporulation